MSEPCVHACIVVGGNGVWYCAACRRTFLPSGDSAIEQEVVRLRALLLESKRKHLVCEGDCWYSCQKSGECCDEGRPNECDCGAQEWNAKVDASLVGAPP